MSYMSRMSVNEVDSLIRPYTHERDERQMKLIACCVTSYMSRMSANGVESLFCHGIHEQNERK